MTTAEMSELKAELKLGNELAKVAIANLARISAGVGELCRALGAIEERVAGLEKAVGNRQSASGNGRLANTGRQVRRDAEKTNG
jgi:hypothetical protein